MSSLEKMGGYCFIKKHYLFNLFFIDKPSSDTAIKLYNYKRRMANMIKIIIPDEVNDQWFEERKLDRMKCNEFLLNLEFEQSDSVAIGKIAKEFNLSNEDATNVFLNAIRDKLASEELMAKVMS